MYVDDAVGICFNHLFGNHLHIACQYNEIDVMFFQQLHFCFFLFHFVLFSNREEIERYTETFCHMLKVGMVTYNQRNFHIPFSGRVACQHIEQAMGQFGNKYGHFGFYIREIKTEFHFIFLGIQGFKIIFYFIFKIIHLTISCNKFHHANEVCPP